MVWKFLSFVIFGMFLINLAAGEVLLDQPKAIYNLNDMLAVSGTVVSTSDANSFLEIDLSCGSESRMVYFSPVSLKAGSSERIEKSLLLSKDFLQTLNGACVIQAKYNNEVYPSQSFKISDKIILSLNMEKIIISPNESVHITGIAVKENAQNVNGFIEAEVEDALIKTSSYISNGRVELNFSFPDNAKARDYVLKLKAYEKSDEEVTNIAEKEIVISVKQEPRKIEILTDKQSVVPGTSLKIKPLIYDQAEELVEGSVKLVVLNSNGMVYLGKIIKSGEEIEINFLENESFGIWEIEASAFSLSSIREFQIEELEKAEFRVLNDTLIITNIGNVPYKKPVMVSIDDVPTSIDSLNLEIGEQKEYVLTGNEAGVHEILISDGEQAFETSAPLLGGVIGVQELRSQLSFVNKHPIVWLFLILVCGLFGFTLSRRIIKRRSYGYAPSSQEMKGFEKISGKTEEKSSVAKIIHYVRDLKEAEPSLVLDGEKEDAGVVVLKIKNFHEIENNKLAKETIERAISMINSHKGTVNRNYDSYTGIFVPSTTRTFRNDIFAVKVAKEIAAYLNEHNARFKDKIDYGIGINSGELAVKVADGKLKFTPLGNTTNLAKRAADSADKNVLLTNNTNKKIMNDVKTLKQGDYYSISRIIEREQNKDFLNKFKERNKI